MVKVGYTNSNLNIRLYYFRYYYCYTNYKNGYINDKYKIL